MKKIYLLPEIKVVKIETTHMIAESMNVYDEGKSFSNSLSRESNNDWEDD